MKNVNLYRIYTEDVNRDHTREITGRYFDGFTLLHGEGVWKGAKENALVIEILGAGDPGEAAVIGMLCEDLKAENEQETVLLAVCPADHFII